MTNTCFNFCCIVLSGTIDPSHYGGIYINIDLQPFQKKIIDDILDPISRTLILSESDGVIKYNAQVIKLLKNKKYDHLNKLSSK